MPPSAFVPTPPTWDVVTAVGIGGLAVLMAGVVSWLNARYQRVSPWLIAAPASVWMCGTAALAMSGVLARFDFTPPPMAVMILLIFGLPVLMACTAPGARAAAAWPVASLVGLQIFRLPLEIVMHRAAGLAIMPSELSYSGYNFDIVTGVGALVLWLAMRVAHVPRALLWAWNLWGLGCLVVIGWIARSSSPMVRAFGDDPRHVNTWVLYVPYVWLPTVLVMIALGGHLVLTRKLVSRRVDASRT